MVRRIATTVRSPVVRCVVWAMFVIIVVVVGSALRWTWLSGNDSPSDTIRNLILVTMAVIGLPLAFWRSLVASRQVETSRLTLANERFQKGAEMLSAPDLHVRLGGIYSLQHLATEHPELYHLQTLRIFCSFLRSHATVEAKDLEKQGIAVAEILRAIGNCTARQVDIEGAWDFYMNLSRIDLSEIEWHDLDIPGERLNFSSVAFSNSNLKGVMLPGAFMFQAKLGGADLSDAYMPGAMLDSCSANSAVFANANLQSSNFDNAQVNAADFTSAMLTRATFRGANLRGAKLCGAHLRDVDFERANLSRADMTQCSGVTQATLDRAVATCGNPPVLEGASDHETRQPLVWRGLEPAPGSGIGRPSVEHRILPNAVDRYPLWIP